MSGRFVLFGIGKLMVSAVALSLTAAHTGSASAETIFGALSKAYMNNSTLNSERAGLRVTDENVPLAKSGYRPTITGTGSLNYTSQTGSRLTTGSFGISISQTLFAGFQNLNNVRAAKAGVYAGQEGLRNVEQNTLFDAASAYMDVIRDRKIAVLRKRNLAFLEEQVRAANARFEVGEGTRTDVAQAQASRSAAIAQLNAARAAAKSSEAIYRQIVGAEPGRLKMASALSRKHPRSLTSALDIAQTEHPAIIASKHLVDAAAFTVKSSEGAFLPTVSATAGLTRNYSNRVPGSIFTPNGYSNSASIGATLSVPIYQGGRASATVRQNKESLGKARIDVDVARDQVRAAATSAWTQYEAATASVGANRDLVSSAQLALSGVIEERKVGQRTTLDVLDAQADVINAQINLATSERDTVVASYGILSAIGWLSAGNLGLKVSIYRPKEHYNAVKDKWFGLRTPDGR